VIAIIAILVKITPSCHSFFVKVLAAGMNQTVTDLFSLASSHFYRLNDGSNFHKVLTRAAKDIYLHFWFYS